LGTFMELFVNFWSWNYIQHKSFIVGALTNTIGLLKKAICTSMLENSLRAWVILGLPALFKDLGRKKEWRQCNKVAKEKEGWLLQVKEFKRTTKLYGEPRLNHPNSKSTTHVGI